MAHSIVVAEQIIKFLELINEPNKSKDFLNELKATAAEIKSRQGLLQTKEDIEAFALKVKKENSDTLADIAKKQKKCNEDMASLEAFEKTVKANADKWQKEWSVFIKTREDFEKLKVEETKQMEAQKEKLANKEKELNRMIEYNAGMTKVLEEKQEALKQLLR